MQSPTAYPSLYNNSTNLSIITEQPHTIVILAAHQTISLVTLQATQFKIYISATWDMYIIKIVSNQ